MLFEDFRRRLLLEFHKFLRVRNVIVWLVKVREFRIENASSHRGGMKLSHQLCWCHFLLVLLDLLLFHLVLEQVNVVKLLLPALRLVWCRLLGAWGV